MQHELAVPSSTSRQGEADFIIQSFNQNPKWVPLMILGLFIVCPTSRNWATLKTSQRMQHLSTLKSVDVLGGTVTWYQNRQWIGMRTESPTRSFNILNYISFSSSSTRLSSHLKLKHPVSRTSSIRHSFLKWLPHFWNSLPTIDLNWSITTIEHKLSQFFWNHFTVHFNFIIPVHTAIYVLAPDVHFHLFQISD